VSARPAERRVASGAETIIPRKSPSVPKGTHLYLDIDDVLLSLGSRAGYPASGSRHPRFDDRAAGLDGWRRLDNRLPI